MQMFWRICIFACLCVVFLFVFHSLDVHAQDPTLTVLTDSDQVYAVGETGMMAFLATHEAGLPAAGVELTITYNGLTGVTISNGGTTDRFGLVQVTGVIAAESGVYVEAEWSLGVRVLAARASFEVVNAAGRQEASLAILGVNPSREVAVGEVVKVSFQVSDNGTLVVGVPLTITHNGLRDVTINNGGVTDILGRVHVTGVIARESNVYIRATWEAEQLEATGIFDVMDPALSSAALIVVNSPDPQSPLDVGDTFRQVISIENRDDKFSTLPLSAWQMDVVFNPLMLEVVSVTEGDFLKSDGEKTRYIQAISSGRVTVSQARGALASGGSGGIPLFPGDKGELITITFRVLALAEEALGIHNVLLQSSYGDRRISYAILVSNVFVATHQASKSVNEDVNEDGRVDILDLVAVAGSIGMVSHNPRADVNDDGFVNVLDLITVYRSSLWAGVVLSEQVNDPNEPDLAAPSVKRDVGPATIQTWIDLARIEDDGSAIFDLGIVNLEILFDSRIPTETRLLLNYPNPFNPETWIPYQLSKAVDVTVAIYSVNGMLVRRLDLGHQAAGIYQSKSRAAYWDGRNELGERVASGLYFYTLTAGDFTATRKMLIRK